MSIKIIDKELCTGCGTCVNACPMDVIRRNFDVPEQAPCTAACPAHVNMREYNHLIMMGRYEEAFEKIREANPLFAITGHVCFRPCEERCARKEVDMAVNINSLERYLSDMMLSEPAKKAKQIYCSKVAIVGSGPSGLAAAYILAVKGYPVTVFEKDNQLGGMLRTALPDYRMPKDVLDKQIQYIKDTGVRFVTGKALGIDFTVESLKEEGYEAVLMAIGASKSSKINVPGKELQGVYWGLDFLQDVVAGKSVNVGKKVVVVGGGSVAIDAAMCAKRIGAETVEVYCLENEEEIPAHEEELRFALEEGIQINPGWSTTEIKGNDGKVTNVSFAKCIAVYDRMARFNPTVDTTITTETEADSIIFAIGQSVDLSGVPEDAILDRAHVKADPLTMETNVEGVFAAGIIVPEVDAGSVIGSIATAKEAAESIDRFLKGQDVREGRGIVAPKVHHPPKEGILPAKRQEPETLTVEERKDNFEEIKKMFTEYEFEKEAKRCMGCGSKSQITYVSECQCCAACEHDCPNGAIYVSPEKNVDPMVAYK